MSPVRLREATLGDYEGITALGDKYGLRARPKHEWDHLWVNNPEYHRRPETPIGWVLESERDGVVGSICNVPLRYEFQGRTLAVSAGRCWVTETEYRSYAMLLLDELFGQRDIDLFLNTTVNQHAMDAYTSFESPRVPKGHWDRSGFWITNYRGFARSALAAKKSTALLTYPLAASLLLKDLAARRGMTSKMQITQELGFDERFDVFWSELREKRHNLLLGVRTRELLEWHFRYPLQRNQVYILTACDRDRITAYSIFYRKDKQDYGLKRVRLVDYQSLDDNHEIAASMITYMLAKCREERIHMLEDVGDSLAGITPPHRRQLPSWLYYYKSNDPRLAQPEVWQPSLFDGDSSL